ncbi:MAG: glycosyltransferase [Candidatus Eremiobacteraeota bacterium]|nr:glycosyltransferase [Candidatus Eremiobacteraeota bacterium]
MKLALTGGGTGGHIYPAIAIAEAFRKEAEFAPLEVLFVGTQDRLEAQIVPKAGLPIAFVHAAPLDRSLSLKLFPTAVANFSGMCEALVILHRARPDLLIATGGYVAFPVVAALWLVRALGRSRARIALLEANAKTGLTNRLLSPLVDEFWYATAPPGRALGPRDFVVGTPVRESMRRSMPAEDARLALGLSAAKRTVVVLGGSQGARRINDAAIGLVESGLPEEWQILVVAGEREVARCKERLRGRERVRVVGYLDDPRVAYAAADIVVARAGASTLGELAATATPALLVPYPFATDDHQTMNARAYAAGGAARIVLDGELDGPRLRDECEAALAPEANARLRAAAQLLAGRDPLATIVARVKAWHASNSANP